MSLAGSIALLATLYSSLFGAEHALPLRRRTSRLLARVLANGGVSILAFGAAFLLVNPARDHALEWTQAAGFGLMQLVDLHPAIEFTVTFLLLDLTFYYWHFANHRIAFLWRFHAVHHVDSDLDVTTGFRFHFAEVAFSAGFRALQVVLLGPTALAYATYEIVFQAGTLFHHSNLRLPARFEQGLNLAFVSPRMHGIHHSQRRQETNSNFGVVFTFWDRLHGTLRLDVPQDQIVIGVPGYSTPGDNRTLRLLMQPFRRQRDYWTASDEQQDLRS